MWRIRRAGSGSQWNRLLVVPLVSLFAVLSLGFALGGPAPGALAHGSHTVAALPHTNISVAAFADTLAFPLHVDSSAELVAWEWTIHVDLRGVEDPGLVIALIFREQVLHTNAFFFGSPELSAEVRHGDLFYEIAPADGNDYVITLRAQVAETLPPGDHWILLTIPDAYSLSVAATVAYDVGTMSFEPGVVDDNDGKLFHPSDLRRGTAIDSGDLLAEKSAAVLAGRDLIPQERMAYFAFFRPAAGHWQYQDHFNGNIRTAQGTGLGAGPDATPTPSYTAITTSPASIELRAALGAQSFEHPFRFVTVDLDF